MWNICTSQIRSVSQGYNDWLFPSDVHGTDSPQKETGRNAFSLLLMAEIPNNHRLDVSNPENNGINYQPQLVNAGFQPSTEPFPLCQPWLRLPKLPNDKKLCQSPPLTTPRLAGIDFITIRWKKSSLQKLKETHSLARLHMTTVFVFDCICICMYAFMFVCMCQYVPVCMTKHITKVCLIHASWWRSRSRCITWWTRQWTIYTCPKTKGRVMKLQDLRNPRTHWKINTHFLAYAKIYPHNVI